MSRSLLLSLFLISLLFFGGCGKKDNSADFEIIQENGQTILKKYTGSDKEITIPDGVTEIGDEAFGVCMSVNSVVIPNSVTKIGNQAFWCCNALTSVQIPGSVTEIGDSAFRDCSALTSVTISEGVKEIGDRTFENCSSLTKLEIPQSVTVIGSGAFTDCNSLTFVEIPENVTKIEKKVFRGCPKLTIQVAEGSKAEEYAKKNNIPYKVQQKEIATLENSGKVKNAAEGDLQTKVELDDKNDSQLKEEVLAKEESQDEENLEDENESQLEKDLMALDEPQDDEELEDEDESQLEKDLMALDEPQDDEEPDDETKLKPGFFAGERKVLMLDGIEYAFRWCPPGEFMMGGEEAFYRDAEPIHKVKLTQGFWMLEIEVTQAMWLSVMGLTVKQQRDKYTNSNYPLFVGNDYPIYWVNWIDCQEFCRKLSWILRQQVKIPTEAQWEYACRVGRADEDKGYSGEYIAIDWYRDKYPLELEGRINTRVFPVGKSPSNPWGLYDMNGNVWEYCSDWYDKDYYSKSPTNDPENIVQSSFHVCRGGSIPLVCGSRAKDRNGPDGDVGLRILIVPDQENVVSEEESQFEESPTTEESTSEPEGTEKVTVPDDFLTIEDAYAKIKDGGVIIIKPGNYELSKTLEVSRSVTFKGDTKHPKNVVIDCPESDAFRIAGGSPSFQNLTVSSDGKYSANIKRPFTGFYITGGTPRIFRCIVISRKGIGIGVDGKDANPTVEKCAIKKCGMGGVSILNEGHGKFFNCEFYENLNGVSSDSGTPAFTECKIHNNSLCGISVSDGNPTFTECKIHDGVIGVGVIQRGRGDFRDCEIYGNKKVGIDVEEFGNPTVTGCKVHDQKDTGIFVTKEGLGKFTNCEIYGNAENEVQVADSGNPTVIGCKIHDGKDEGVCVLKGGLGEFSDCEIYGNAVTGLLVMESGNPKVTGCKIRDGITGVGVSDGGRGEFNNCEIYRNEGGIGVFESGNPTITECKIHNEERFGVLVGMKGSGKFSNCDIYGNFIGIGVKDSGNPTVTKCKIRDGKK